MGQSTGATVFSMSQPTPRGLFAPPGGEWATFQIGLLCATFEFITPAQKTAINLSRAEIKTDIRRWVGYMESILWI